MNSLRLLVVASVMVRIGLPANLVISTYLKDGFTPTAIASDSQSNVYLAGSAVIDAASQATGAIVAKLDPKATQYLYLAYLDSAASDQVSGIAIDGSGTPTSRDGPRIRTSRWSEAAHWERLRPAAATRGPLNEVEPARHSGVFGPNQRLRHVHGPRHHAKPQGQVLISGMAGGSGFPFTPGAYNVPDSTNHWFLMELDAAADKMIFSATGIGGSSIALDAAGNIYVAGSSTGTDYPTTAGAYQTTFVQGSYCFGFYQFGYLGNLQHVTKVDPAGSKLIYSTGLNDLTRTGSTTNAGLAVDAAGNAYVTGTLFEAQYPFTVPVPNIPTAAGFVTKLDPAGAKVLFSVAAGGGGVQLDSSGALYVGGTVTTIDPYVNIGVPPLAAATIPAVFAGIPRACVPNYATAISEAYVMKLDPATGTVQDAQWIDGSAPGATGIALAGGNVWIAGPTPAPDVPFTPGVLAPETSDLVFSKAAICPRSASLAAPLKGQ